jgi:hypothetical protein
LTSYVKFYTSNTAARKLYSIQPINFLHFKFCWRKNRRFYSSLSCGSSNAAAGTQLRLLNTLQQCFSTARIGFQSLTAICKIEVLLKRRICWDIKDVLKSVISVVNVISKRDFNQYFSSGSICRLTTWQIQGTIL